MQVPALKKHLQATLKSEEEFLAGADAGERQSASDAARPGTPPPQEQQLRQAHVSSHPVETVRCIFITSIRCDGRRILWRVLSSKNPSICPPI